MSTEFDDVVMLSQNQMRIHNRRYQRVEFRDDFFESRFTMLLGPRGVGKTTAMVQHLVGMAGGDVLHPSVLYVPSDHIALKEWSLYRIGEAFALRGGRCVCFDEVHKVVGWARELKSLYDSFPELRMIASGSSALEVATGGYDLSRRALVRHVQGLSFREFVELRHGVDLPMIALSDITRDHARRAEEILGVLKTTGKRVLAMFRDYLRAGYFPFFVESPDESIYLSLLEQNARTILESDILAVRPSFTGATVRKMERLLSVVAASVPFKPDLKALKKVLDIGDERTLKSYLLLMEKAGLILSLAASGRGLRTMEKPDKIYLGNTNYVHAFVQGRPEVGNLRETFFLSQVGRKHEVSTPRKGDFFVDGTWTFEVGGRNKDGSQIRGAKEAYLALDDIERGTGRRIPLWLFGFLY